jgi:putative endonuclease
LVRTPACHAGGREFESRPDRNYKPLIEKWVAFFVAGGRPEASGSLVRIANKSCSHCERLFLFWESKYKQENMHYLYILYSHRVDQYYSGHCFDVDQRLAKHNAGKSRATHRGVPWELKRVIEFPTKSEAIQAENWIKRMKSRKVIEKIISGEFDLKNVLNHA